jgi:hypothetical protein
MQLFCAFSSIFLRLGVPETVKKSNRCTIQPPEVEKWKTMICMALAVFCKVLRPLNSTESARNVKKARIQSGREKTDHKYRFLNDSLPFLDSQRGPEMMKNDTRKKDGKTNGKKTPQGQHRPVHLAWRGNGKRSSKPVASMLYAVAYCGLLVFACCCCCYCVLLALLLADAVCC